LRVTVNGEDRQLPEGLTLEALIHHLALAPDRLAIERNRQVVRRADWPQTILSEDDRIEIIHFVGGG
jgi:thiamine biosynthesis protein ThiS